MGYAVLSNRNTRVGVQRKNTVKAELANLMARNDLAEASAEITFIPPGKLRCVITDRLRNDTPEENVRQRVARSLIDEYGYGREDIAVEFTVNLGSSKKRVDLAIFPPEPNTNSRMLT